MLIEKYRELVGDDVIYEIFQKARKLYEKRVIHINSTYMGGGVAEILMSLIPLLNEIGIYAGWRLLNANPDFFSVTKKIHNALQGENVNFNKEELDLYIKTNEYFSKYTHLNHDIIIINDPQPLPLINFYKKKQPWISRIHIDLSEETPTLKYLKNFLIKYDKIIISSDKYRIDNFPVDCFIIQPAIDPSTIKNCRLTDYDVKRVLNKYNIPTDKPIITQISRFDKWKQPLEVIDIFEKVKSKIDCRLILCGSMASDGPEGIEIFNKVKAKADKFNGDVILITVESGILVNVIQTISDAVIQFSKKEGFCLCVTEAMFKKKPVVATNIGGIPLQIEDGVNGFLVEPSDINNCAEKIIEILKNKKLADELGERARKTVIDKFLMTRLLLDHMNLMIKVLYE